MGHTRAVEANRSVLRTPVDRTFEEMDGNLRFHREGNRAWLSFTDTEGKKLLVLPHDNFTRMFNRITENPSLAGRIVNIQGRFEPDHEGEVPDGYHGAITVSEGVIGAERHLD